MAQRKSPRYSSNAQIFIAEVPDTEAAIKNLSTSGLCIESPQFIDILPNGQYQAEVIPEKDSNLDTFTIEIQSKWIRTRMTNSESGFVIIVPPQTPGSKVLDKYLEYLAKHSEPLEES